MMIRLVLSFGGGPNRFTLCKWFGNVTLVNNVLSLIYSLQRIDRIWKFINIWGVLLKKWNCYKVLIKASRLRKWQYLRSTEETRKCKISNLHNYPVFRFPFTFNLPFSVNHLVFHRYSISVCFRGDNQYFLHRI